MFFNRDKASRGGFVPGWSTEIANEFIKMAAAEGKALTQMHLQELVYIAHGWCLAIKGQPLTGDRPEAMEHGPEYRLLANALARCGIKPVKGQIEAPRLVPFVSKADAIAVDDILDEGERTIMAEVYSNYARRPTAELAALTRADDTPWARMFADGAGKGRDISHQMIRDQFEEIGAKFGR